VLREGLRDGAGAKRGFLSTEKGEAASVKGASFENHKGASLCGERRDALSATKRIIGPYQRGTLPVGSCNSPLRQKLSCAAKCLSRGTLRARGKAFLPFFACYENVLYGGKKKKISCALQKEEERSFCYEIGYPFERQKHPLTLPRESRWKGGGAKSPSSQIQTSARPAVPRNCDTPNTIGERSISVERSGAGSAPRRVSEEFGAETRSRPKTLHMLGGGVFLNYKERFIQREEKKRTSQRYITLSVRRKKREKRIPRSHQEEPSPEEVFLFTVGESRTAVLLCGNCVSQEGSRDSFQRLLTRVSPPLSRT